MNGAKLIAAERERQIKREGWTAEHDDEHSKGEMAIAAACYASPKPLFVHEKRMVQMNSSRGADENCYVYDRRLVEDYFDPWPWDEDKRNKHDRLRQLVIAGALIAAEIDRLQRLGEVRKKPRYGFPAEGLKAGSVFPT